MKRVSEFKNKLESSALNVWISGMLKLRDDFCLYGRKIIVVFE